MEEERRKYLEQNTVPGRRGRTEEIKRGKGGEREPHQYTESKADLPGESQWQSQGPRRRLLSGETPVLMRSGRYIYPAPVNRDQDLEFPRKGI